MEFYYPRITMNRALTYTSAALVFCVSVSIGLSAPQAADAKDFRSPEVRIFEMQKNGTKQKKQKAFNAFDAKSENGGQIATGNIDGKGPDEIIVGAGPGEKPYVRVYTSGGKLISQFYAYDQGMQRGVNVAAGDLNNDGKDEIVTGTGTGASPHVRTFNYKGKPVVNKGFYPFEKSFRGGVHVAVGNVRGSAKGEIIVATGPGSKPRVHVYKHTGKRAGVSLQPFGNGDKGGVSVAVGNVDGGEYAEVITAIHSFGEPRVKVYNVQKTKEQTMSEFVAYNIKFHGGVNVAAGDTNRDGKDEIVTATRQSGGPHVRTFRYTGKVLDQGFSAYEKDFRGGVSVAVGNVDRDSKPEIVTIPQKRRVEGRLDLYKYIDVDLSEQKLRAYRNGIVEKEFLISSGVAKYSTPTGSFHVRKKILRKDYEWSYGDNHPDNYDIKDVPYNLQFLPTYYLHNAYWHNNFGHPMSHGCVNINLENSRWIYHWADVGDPVLIHQ